MKSKIQHVTGNGTYPSDYGVMVNGKKIMYKFEYTFEDGTTMNAGHKTETCPFKNGDEVEYEVKNDHPTYGKSGSVKKPQDPNSNYSGNNSKGSGDYQTGIAVGHAINNAVNLMCAGVDLGIKECDTNEEKIYEGAKVIMQISSRLIKEC